MKNKIVKILILILVILIVIYHRNNVFTAIQKYNLQLMKLVTKTLKKEQFTKYLFFVFCYGMVHSLSPGHGKTYLLNRSLTTKTLKLILISGLIAYGQGILSYLLVIFWVKSINELQNLNSLSLNIYGITLIALAIFNTFSEVFHKEQKQQKNKENYFLLGLFFPCSGVLSVLLLGYLINKNLSLITVMVVLSSGIFVSLSIFSIVIKNITLVFTDKKMNFKVIHILFNLFILIIGCYTLTIK